MDGCSRLCTGNLSVTCSPLQLHPPLEFSDHFQALRGTHPPAAPPAAIWRRCGWEPQHLLLLQRPPRLPPRLPLRRPAQQPPGLP